jgi:hypothetical protein
MDKVIHLTILGAVIGLMWARRRTRGFGYLARKVAADEQARFASSYIYSARTKVFVAHAAIGALIGCAFGLFRQVITG